MGLPRQPDSRGDFRRWPLYVMAALLGCFCLLAAAVWIDGQPYFTWDLAVTRVWQGLSRPWLDALMRAVSWAGDDVINAGLLCGGAALALLVWRARREAAFLLAVLATGQVIKIAIKFLIARPRPRPDLARVLIEAKEIYSFPSGHTVHYTVFFGFLAVLALVLLKRPILRWGAVAVLGALVLLVGPARVYLGAHWASDVLGGYLLGGAVLLAYVYFYLRSTKPTVPESPPQVNP